jgi:hypothetical protein
MYCIKFKESRQNVAHITANIQVLHMHLCEKMYGDVCGEQIKHKLKCFI